MDFMDKIFDTTDIFFIAIISIYFIALFLFILIFLIRYFELRNNEKKGITETVNHNLVIEKKDKTEKRETIKELFNKFKLKYQSLIKRKKRKKPIKKKVNNTKKRQNTTKDIKTNKKQTTKGKKTTKKKAQKRRANNTTPKRKKNYKNNISYVKNNPKKK